MVGRDGVGVGVAVGVGVGVGVVVAVASGAVVGASGMLVVPPFSTITVGRSEPELPWVPDVPDVLESLVVPEPVVVLEPAPPVSPPGVPVPSGDVPEPAPPVSPPGVPVPPGDVPEPAPPVSPPGVPVPSGDVPEPVVPVSAVVPEPVPPVWLSAGPADSSVLPPSAQAMVPGSAHSNAARSRTENSFFQFFFMFTISSLNSKWFCIVFMFSALSRIPAAQCLRTSVFTLYHCPG